jgi:hypothetical protein
MRTISFQNGYKMPWPVFRAMMLGQLSPPQAVAATRRGPEAAYDAAMPRRQARDENGGKLSA